MTIGLFGAALALAALANPAAADKTKFTRAQDLKVDVKLSDRVKPLVAAHDDKPAGPTVTGDDALAIEGALGGVRDDQEQILVDLIASAPDSDPDKPEYYLRLGELYAKQQRYWRLVAIEDQVKADAATDAKQKSALVAKAAVAAENAKQKLLKAVKTFGALTGNDAFRNYAKIDLALFYDAFTLHNGGYLTEARGVYDKLLKNYPNSKFVPEAHLAFADYAFEQGQLDDAQVRYEQVLKFPKSSAYWYAMYKLGWIQLNKQRAQDALETFFQVAQGTRGDAKYAVLERAAKKDFVRAYAEVGKADKAYPAFQRVDGKYAFDMLAILGDLYLGQGKSDKAIYVYQTLMKTAPANKDVCLWQYNITHAELSLHGASDSDKVHEIENLVRLWGGLAHQKILPAAEAQDCHDNAAAMAGQLARAYHSESARTRNPETLAFAERLYKAYLDVFADADDFAETQYFYAELLWSRAETEKNARLQTDLWQRAAGAFTAVVKLGKVDATLMQKSAYAAVLAWQNALDADPRTQPQPQVAIGDEAYDKVPVPQPIPERDQKMLAAFELYIHYIKDPHDEELVLMRFLAADTYRRYDHYAEAIPIFTDILAHHRAHEMAETTARLLLDSYNRQHRYDDMLALVDQLAADAKFLDGKPGLKELLDHLKAQALAKHASKLEGEAKASGDFSKYVACGGAYLDIYNRNPASADNDVALYNAGVCYEEGKSIGAAIQMFNLLAKLYPNSTHTAKAIARLGKAYGDVAYYREASDKLEEYAKRYAGEADAYRADGEAVLFRKGIGDDAKAIEDTKYFVRTFGPKQPLDAAAADFALTSVYEKQGDTDAIVAHLRGYVRDHGSKGGADRLVIAYAKIGAAIWAQSCPVKPIDGACVKITRARAVSKQHAARQLATTQKLTCGDDSNIKLTVVPRDARKVHDALAALAAAAHELDARGGKTGGDDAGAHYYDAQSKLIVADRDYEAYLALAFPSGLDFDPNHPAIAAKSLARFDAWAVAKNRAGVATAEKYAAVLAIQDNASSITAAARLGQISQNFADALFTAEIPKNVRTGEFAEDKVAAFCDKLNEYAEPLEAKALAAYTTCLAESTKLGWFSEWSRVCERELGQIEPDKYPTASELRSPPTQVASVRDVEAPMMKLE